MMRGVFTGALVVAGCSTTPPAPAPPEPSFPAAYATTYREVRNCRQSSEHDLRRVRVLADPTAFGPYQARDRTFPVGAIVLKEEYDIADVTCAGPVVQWTVMKRLGKNAAPTKLDWAWEEVDEKRAVVGRDTPRCYGCHTDCTPETDGFENTCAVP